MIGRSLKAYRMQDNVTFLSAEEVLKWTDMAHHLYSCCVTDIISISVLLNHVFLWWFFFFFSNYTDVTCLPMSLLLNAQFPLFLLAIPWWEEESGVYLINLLKDVRLIAQADTETEINDPCLGEFIFLHYGVNHISEIETSQKQECSDFSFFKPNCQLITHTSNHLTN